MGCPKNTSDFSAIHNLMPPGPFPLRVSLTVETTKGNQRYSLKKRVPQGFNPQHLLLDLVDETQGSIGPEVMGEQAVIYEENAEEDQYTDVMIFCDGNPISGGPVEKVY